jgi:NAD(P)-dependent dehydrogenase (short-subunit alcohol dehydrogenase family)
MEANVLGLTGKNALVVGGGFGMGRETALLLARVGANVAVADLDLARAQAVQAEVEALGGKATAIAGDVTRAEDARRVVDEAVAFFGRLEVVCNVVGLASWADLFGIDDDAWANQFAINLVHHANIGRAAARHMIDNKIPGRMAFVASVSGLYGAPMHAAYGAAKAGLMALVRTMSQEWGPYGIRVNAVAPDLIATPRVKAGFDAQGITPAQVAAREGVSLGRMGEPFDIAGPLVFLVSDLSAFISGQTIISDGGTHAAFPHARVNAFVPED